MFGTASETYWAKLRTRLKRDYVEALPTQPNVLRCQFACQWNGDERTERYALNARTFADMAAIGAREGMQGLTVWGEPSPYFATVEASYLAFSRFTWNPKLTFEDFVATDLAPLFGGRELAERFVAVAEEIVLLERLEVAQRRPGRLPHRLRRLLGAGFPHQEEKEALDRDHALPQVRDFSSSRPSAHSVSEWTPVAAALVALGPEDGARNPVEAFAGLAERPG